MSAIAAMLAFCCAFGSGVYLIVHDHATIGAWICILCLFATWGYEKESK